MNKWEEQEVEFLNENYKNMTCEEIARTLTRSISSVENKAKMLGLKKRTFNWTKEMKEILINEYVDTDINELADKLDMEKFEIYSMANNLGLKKPTAYRRWTEEEYVKIRKNYGIMTDQELGEMLNRTEYSIKQKIRQLKANNMLNIRSKLIMEELE